jgi:RNA polymerase sigma factor (sigma-70 family)
MTNPDDTGEPIHHALVRGPVERNEETAPDPASQTITAGSTPDGTGGIDALAVHATRGDPAALRALCERLQGPVYRLALRMLGHTADAEDATQEIVIQVITRLSTFEGRSKLMTWVYTIASRHLLRTRARSRERARSAESLAAQLDAGLALSQTAAALHLQEAPLLEKELRIECVHGMLLVLSRPERLAFILADVLGASDRIGAEICEIAPDAFRQRLSRARAEMRPLLAERCGLAEPTNPCRCASQTRAAYAANLIHPSRLRFATLPDEPSPELARADEELGALHRIGRVFAGDIPLAPPRELWQRIASACPELLR